MLRRTACLTALLCAVAALPVPLDHRGTPPPGDAAAKLTITAQAPIVSPVLRNTPEVIADLLLPNTLHAQVAEDSVSGSPEEGRSAVFWIGMALLAVAVGIGLRYVKRKFFDDDDDEYRPNTSAGGGMSSSSGRPSQRPQ